jgi:4-aminobutyrate aminotransferase-like enzyme
MALAQIREIQRRDLVRASRSLGRKLRHWLGAAVRGLKRLQAEVRVVGLMAGVELRRPDGSPAGAESVEVVQRLLREGFVVLPEGEHGEVVSLTPPLTIRAGVLQQAVEALARVLREVDAA